MVRGKGKLIMQNPEHKLLYPLRWNAEEEECCLMVNLTKNTNIDTVGAKG